MRGKLDDETAPIVRYRITPAGAGKTCAGRYSTYHSQDHPRRCGENDAPLWTRRRVLGSPPQVRGKHAFLHCWKIISGITPAGAGKTRQCGRVDSGTQDHPRRCGENRKLSAYAQTVQGSPPQVRGKHSKDPFGISLFVPEQFKFHLTSQTA